MKVGWTAGRGVQVFARLLGLLGFVGALCGQGCHPGEIRIYIKDTLETPVLNARVQLASAGKVFGVFTTRTEGLADFTNAPCGAWTVSVTKDGFEDGSLTFQRNGEQTLEQSVVLSPKVVRASTDVTASSTYVEPSSSENNELRPQDVKTLPTNPATVAETLPLVPGVVRTPQGELLLDGTGEQRSAFVVNQSDVTDPATGKFGQTVPLDAIETVNVLNVPFLAQYGRFTQTVVAVETKRGGDKWHADLNDPFPDFRIRSYHMRGILNEAPRFVVGGPLLKNRVYFNSAVVYVLDKVPSRTLGFPYNESKHESINSFTQLDYILSQTQIITSTLHYSPQHVNFVNPDYFNPQRVSPSYADKSYVGTVAHHFAILGGTLDSSLSIQRFDTHVGTQGNLDMFLTPQGNSGNFFGPQIRSAKRNEWLENWSPKLFKFAGSHQTRFGSSYTSSGSEGQFSYRPVNIQNAAGQTLQRITFSDPGAYTRNDVEATGYFQDHWTLSPKLSFDYGARIEHQRLATSLRIAPRAGFSWSPFANERTVFRFGWGDFYDHIPLDVYAFSRYPSRTITTYAPDGSVLGVPLVYDNVIGSVTGPRSFFIKGQQVAGAFSPRGSTFNAQVEHRVSSVLRLRAVYLDNRSVGLISVEPQLLGNRNEIVLNGDGASHYRQAEFTAKVSWKAAEQLNMSYVRSRDRGTLNEFDNFIGNYPTPLIRPMAFSNLPGDLPNRFLIWGRVNPHLLGLTIMPIVEYRNGFPYATYDVSQNYFGTPFSDKTRFRNFFSADARLLRDFKVNPKYTLRLSLAGFNLTNHFNPLLVHSNIADPQYGSFFGNYHRRYRFDFEVIF